jgi:hypothetical protein
MSFFPRPVWPGAAYADLRAFLKTRTPHQVGFASLAIVVPIFMLGLFYVDEVPMEYKRPEITWIKTYPKGRTDAEIAAQQKIDTAKRKADEAEEKLILEARRAPFKALDKKLDKLGL